MTADITLLKIDSIRICYCCGINRYCGLPGSSWVSFSFILIYIVVLSSRLLRCGRYLLFIVPITTPLAYPTAKCPIPLFSANAYLHHTLLVPRDLERWWRLSALLPPASYFISWRRRTDIACPEKKSSDVCPVHTWQGCLLILKTERVRIASKRRT